MRNFQINFIPSFINNFFLNLFFKLNQLILLLLKCLWKILYLLRIIFYHFFHLILLLLLHSQRFFPLLLNALQFQKGRSFLVDFLNSLSHLVFHIALQQLMLIKFVFGVHELSECVGDLLIQVFTFDLSFFNLIMFAFQDVFFLFKISLVRDNY